MTQFPPSAPFGGILDIYSGNDFNPQQCWDAGIRLVIHKAGQWEDPNLPHQRDIYMSRKAQWESLGGMWGNYFLSFAASSAKEMFDAWLECDDTTTTLFRAIDWEDDGSGETVSQEDVRDLARLFEDHFGYLPVLYGSNTLTEMEADAVLSVCPGWYAQVGYQHQPTTFAPKHPPDNMKLVLHQWTQDGDAATKPYDGGDLNIYNGTLDQLVAALPSFNPKPQTCPLT